MRAPDGMEGGRESILHRLGSASARAASLSPVNPAARLALHLGLGFLVLGGLVLAAVAQGDQLSGRDWRLKPMWLILGVLGFVVFQACHAELWRLCIIRLGAQLEPRRARAIWNVTLLGRYVPTGALMAVGRAAAGERAGVAKRVSLVSFAYEVVLTLVSASVVAAAFVVALPSIHDRPERWAVLILPVVGLALLHPRLLHAAMDRILVALGREPLPMSLSVGDALRFTVAYVGTYVLAGAATWFVARAVQNVPTSDLPFVLTTFAVGFIASVLGFLLPGGLGVREAGLAVALSAVMPFSVGVAVAILVRVVQFVIEVAFAMTFSLVARRRRPG